MRITSLQNPHIKNCVKLQQRRERDRQQMMIVEGYRAILQAMKNCYPLITLYYCPELFFGQREPILLRDAEHAGVRLLEIAAEPFRKMATLPRPDGLLALAPQIRHALGEHRPQPNSFFLVAESIEKPSNLGAIIRSVDGAGADALIVCDPQVDIFNPDVMRASVGTFFTVPLLTASTKQVLQWCRTHGVVIMAATPQADMLYTEVDMRGAIAIAVGNEQHGLRGDWLCEADLQVKLPMHGQINSLNVTVAAALLLYEVVRQRSSCA